MRPEHTLPVLRGGGDESAEDNQPDPDFPILNSSNVSPEDADSDFLEFDARNQPAPAPPPNQAPAYTFILAAVAFWLYVNQGQGIPCSTSPPTPPADRLSPPRSLRSNISDNGGELLTRDEAGWMERNVHAIWGGSESRFPRPNQWLQWLQDQGDHDTLAWFPPRSNIRSTEDRRGSVEGHHDTPNAFNPPALTADRSNSSRCSNDNNAKGESKDDSSSLSEAQSAHALDPDAHSSHSPDNA